MTIRIASYNIRKCMGLDRRRDPARTMAAIESLSPDIIVLQEADRRFGARQSAIPPDILAGAGGYRAVPLHIRPGGLGWHGNAILVRGDVEVISAQPLTLPMLEPRGAVIAELRVRGTLMRVIGAHLDLSGLWRRRQVRAIMAHIDALSPHRPLAIMGDFNQWSNRGALSELAFHHHRLVPTPPSFHTRRPVARLDRIIVSHDVHVVDSGVHLCTASRIASDHLPVWADVRLTHGL